jgi:hypothetical protein
MVDPAVTMCAAAAEEKARLRPRWDRAVFVVNCLDYLEVGVDIFWERCVLCTCLEVLIVLTRVCVI